LRDCFSEEEEEEELVCLSMKDNLVEEEEQGSKQKSDFENTTSLGTEVVCCRSIILVPEAGFVAGVLSVL
jgi:hypothetical protein